MLGWLLTGGAVVVDAVASCSGETACSGLTDGWSSAVVFVVGSDVADRGVQPDGVVLGSDPGEFHIGHPGSRTRCMFM